MSGEMTSEEASRVTQAIARNSSDLAHLVKQARDGQAWRALGFATFDEWARESFGWHRSRAYQLINVATLNEELHNRVALPESWTISDRQTRRVIQIGSQEFIDAFENVATQDADRNVQVFNSLLVDHSQHPTSQASQVANAAPVPQAPSRISGGVRDSRTALVMVNSLEQQTKAFPAANMLSQGVRLQVAQTLESVASETRNLLIAFDRAIAERLEERDANAQ